MNDDGRLLTLVLYLAMLSLLAVGGMNTALPDMHRMLVEQNGWLTDRQFTSLYALAQAAPGPNFLFATLIGWQLSGLAGAVLGTLAICGPAGGLAFVMAFALRRWPEVRWFKLVRQGLVPVTLGLVAASAYLLSYTAATSWRSYVVVAATTLMTLTTRISPLWALAAAGLLGALGIV